MIRMAGLVMILGVMAWSSVALAVEAQRTRDLVYSRPDGTALTMDEFVPAEPNGNVVMVVVSGGWYSSYGAIDGAFRAGSIDRLLEGGYKVYAVVHRSSPRFTIEDAIADVQRAVRFVRHREKQDGGTTVSIGITGASAGGHLSLLAGMTGDDGDAAAEDPVARESSRVQAVACFYPPTDFLNYGDTDVNVLETTVGKNFPASFDFQRQEEDPVRLERLRGKYNDVTDAEELRKILREVSPVTHVTSDDPPSLIVHGDADALVPWQQSDLMVKALEKAGVEAELVTKPGEKHGWKGQVEDVGRFVEWFDKYLSKAKE